MENLFNFIFNNIKKYIIFIYDKNIIDFKERKKAFLNYKNDINFNSNIVYLLGSILLIFIGITSYVGIYIFSIILFITIIDIILGRFLKIIKEINFIQEIKAKGFSGFFDYIDKEIFDSKKSLYFEFINENIQENNINHKLINKINSIFKKFFSYIKSYIEFHEKLAKNITMYFLKIILLKFIPNKDFDNYNNKVAYFLLLPIKYIFNKILNIIIYLFKKIIYIFIILIIIGICIKFPDLIPIIGILFFIYIIYILFNKIKNFVLAIIKLIKRFKYIFSGLLIILFTYFSGFYILLYLELSIIVFSIFFLVLIIIDKFLGVSILKCIYIYIPIFIIGLFNISFSFLMLIFSRFFEDEKNSEYIIKIISGKYKSNIYDI